MSHCREAPPETVSAAGSCVAVGDRHAHVKICPITNCSRWHTVEYPLRACVPMRNVCCFWVVSHRGQSDSQDNKNYTFIPLMQVCFPGKMAPNWIYSLCESHTCLMSRVRLSEILDKCTVARFPASAHLLDPFGLLQIFKEGVFTE